MCAAMSGAAAHIYGLHTNGTILESVKSVRTAKLKLAVTPEQHAALRATQRAYQEVLNFVSQCAFAHGKMSNQKRLQRDTYADVRAMFGLPAQMACNVPRQVGATYKVLWTKTGETVDTGPQPRDRQTDCPHAPHGPHRRGGSA